MRLRPSSRARRAAGWPMITRIKLIGDLILASVKDGCDCVFNLGAGLDTRPYRLALPPSFTGTEAYLPKTLSARWWRERRRT
jgi:O-methyltransferase involved in polyketide biosynthesis